MLTIHLTGKIIPDGQLQLEIPNLDEQFTEEEVKELLTFTPTNGAEVVAADLIGDWEHKGITDPVAWVEEQQCKQKERRGW